jgi:hypothetical protein
MRTEKLAEAREFGRTMGRLANASRNNILDPRQDSTPKGSGIKTIVNSPSENERRTFNTGEALSQLWGGMDPKGFVNPNSWYGTNRDNKNQLSRAKDPRLGDNSPVASQWRSANVPDKVRELSNEKHYAELANMNRANPPKDINGIPAARISANEQYNTNAAHVLPYLINPKRIIPGAK